MDLIFKIAWRNIIKHKRKSLIIGLILFLGALIMTLGNGVISGMDKGLKENILNRFTGHIIVVSSSQKENNVFFSPMGKGVEVIQDYPKVKEFLQKQQFIEKFIPAGKGMVLVLNEEGDPGFSFLLGMNFEDYQKMFDNLVPVEGRLLKNDERGLLYTTKQRKELFDFNNYWIVPENCSLDEKNLTPEAKLSIKDIKIKNNVIFMGFSENNTSLDIRASVKGVVKYKSLNEVWGHFNLIDIESFRECMGYVTAADNNIEVPKEKIELLNMNENNINNLFGEDSISEESASGKKIEKIDFSKKEMKSDNSKIDIDNGSYNLVFIKLKNDRQLNQNLKFLNDSLKKTNLNVRAISWKKAVGQISDMATVIRGSLFGFVMFLFFVAIIIIMNTLSMAALERVSEIGMMRAVGAPRRFISLMFVSETGILSFIFGGAGILTGIIITYVVAMFNITTTNDILQLFFGGDTFRPMLGMLDILLGILQLIIVTVFAIIYPVMIARKISPLDAITRD